MCVLLWPRFDLLFLFVLSLCLLQLIHGQQVVKSCKWIGKEQIAGISSSSNNNQIKPNRTTAKKKTERNWCWQHLIWQKSTNDNSIAWREWKHLITRGSTKANQQQQQQHQKSKQPDECESVCVCVPVFVWLSTVKQLVQNLIFFLFPFTTCCMAWCL